MKRKFSEKNILNNGKKFITNLILYLIDKIILYIIKSAKNRLFQVNILKISQNFAING